jgi:hypothetical protein
MRHSHNYRIEYGQCREDDEWKTRYKPFGQGTALNTNINGVQH